MPRQLRYLLAGLALIALVLVTYRQVTGLAMLGWDGWPLVAASRVQGLGDLLGTFGEELMDGRYPHGHFYRPITHLAFAFDGAVSGLDPAGYHRTDLALLAACALTLAALVTRLAGGWAGLLAGALFVLHPLQLELLPVPARRADSLALLFGLACLLVQPKDAGSRGRTIAVGLLAALAAGSKETGVWIAPAVIGWHLLHGARPRAALRASAPVLVGVGLYVLARTIVLGGIGGHSGDLGPAVSTAELWSGLMAGLLYPEPLVGAPSAALLIGVGLSLALVLVAVAFAAPREERVALGVFGVMLLSLLALTSLADRLHSWYAVLFTAPLAGALAILLVRGVKLCRAGRRALGAAACTVAGVFSLSLALGSPLVRSYPLLEASSDWLSASYRRLDQVVEGAQPGQVVTVEGWPVGVPPAPDGRDVQSLALAREYTVAAYLELLFPNLGIDVRFKKGGVASPKPEVLTLLLVPGGLPPGVEKHRDGK